MAYKQFVKKQFVDRQSVGCGDGSGVASPASTMPISGTAEITDTGSRATYTSGHFHIDVTDADSVDSAAAGLRLGTRHGQPEPLQGGQHHADGGLRYCSTSLDYS